MIGNERTQTKWGSGWRMGLAGAFLALLAGCSGFDPGEPAAGDSAVAEVLVDLQILEARQRLGYAVSPPMRDSVLSLHGIDERQLGEAMDYYAEHPSRFVAVYGIVLRRLEAEQYGDAGEAPRGDTAFAVSPAERSGRISRLAGRASSPADSTQPGSATPARTRLR